MLTNGMNVGGAGRHARPRPARSPPARQTLDVHAGQGLRLQIVNAATIRFFRLRLTDSAGVAGPARPRRRRGRAARQRRRRGRHRRRAPSTRSTTRARSCSTRATAPTSWRPSRPARRRQRADAVDRGLPAHRAAAASRTSRPCRSCTSTSPAAPVGSTRSPTARRCAPRPATPSRRSPRPTGTLLNPATFSPPKLGMVEPGHPSSPHDRQHLGINGIHRRRTTSRATTPTSPHLGSTRYAEVGDIARADGHEHDRRAPPVPPARLLDPADRPDDRPARPDATRSLHRVQGQHRRPARVHADLPGPARRPAAGGRHTGGALGRWLFHCHIFFHATSA